MRRSTANRRGASQQDAGTISRCTSLGKSSRQRRLAARDETSISSSKPAVSARKGVRIRRAEDERRALLHGRASMPCEGRRLQVI